MPTQTARLVVPLALLAAALLLGLVTFDTLTGSRLGERLRNSSLEPQLRRVLSPATATVAIVGVVVFSVFGSPGDACADRPDGGLGLVLLACVSAASAECRSPRDPGQREGSWP